MNSQTTLIACDIIHHLFQYILILINVVSTIFLLFRRVATVQTLQEVLFGPQYEAIAATYDPTWFNSAYLAAISYDSEAGVFISPQELDNMLGSIDSTSNRSAADLGAFLTRFNLTLTNWNAGVLEDTSNSSTFSSYSSFRDLMDTVVADHDEALLEGYSNILDAVNGALQDFQTALNRPRAG